MAKDLKKRTPEKTNTKLSNNQKQILTWLLKDRWSVNKIQKAKQLNSPNSIYKTIKTLREKGYLTKSLSIDDTNIKHFSKDKHLRLHAEGFTIKILYKESDYDKRLLKSNQDIRYNNTIQLNKNSLTVYSNKDFLGNTIHECFKLSSEYWNKFIHLLEHDYNIILIKPRSTKIYRFRQHIADLRNPLASKVIKERKHFKVYDNNGDIRLLIDHSFIAEFEAVNNKHCKDDMQRVQDFHKDLILKPKSLNLSELTTLSQNNTDQLNKITHQLKLTIELQHQTIITQNNLIQILTPKQREIKDTHKYGSYFN